MLGVLPLAMGALAPRSASASYALYQASQQSFQERKDTKWVPVATNDRETLAQIQGDIARKRPRSEKQLKRKPQYCAGEMSAVQPMMLNVCEDVRAAPPRHLRWHEAADDARALTLRAVRQIGLSKADQSNTMYDAFGNMNVGIYTDVLQEKRLSDGAAKRR